MHRRVFLASAAAFAAFPAYAASEIALFDAAVDLISSNPKRYPLVGPGSPAQGGFPRGTSPPGFGPQQGLGRPIPTAELVLQWMLALNVKRIAAVQNQPAYGYDNSYLLDTAEIYPAQMSPVVMIDVSRSSTATFLHNMIEHKGVAAIRLTGGPATDGTYPWVASDQALQIWQVAADTGIVIDLMYLPPVYSDRALDTIVGLAEKFPTVRIVLDCIGWPDIQNTPPYSINAKYAAIASHKNIYFKFTSTNIYVLEVAGVPADRFLAHAVDVLGADHVMWGSELGTAGGTYEELVGKGRAAAARLSDDDRQLVLHDTGNGFFIRGGLPTALPG